MRLQNMYYLAKTTLDNWADLDLKGVDNANGSKSYNTANFPQVDKMLIDLSPIDMMREYVSAFRDMNGGLGKGSDGAFLSANERNSAISSYDDIRDKLSSIVELFESLGMDDEREGLDIKMPSNMTLSELSTCTKELDFIFTQCPIVKADGEIIELSSVDIGSI